MDKQNVVYPYHEILFSPESNDVLIACYNVDEPLKVMLSERNQTQGTTYYMSPFIWNFQKKQIHGDRKYWFSGLGRSEEWTVTANGYGLSWGVID